MRKLRYLLIILLILNFNTFAETNDQSLLDSLRTTITDTKLIADNAESHRFGSSVSLFGNIAAIGAPGENLTGYRGSVFIYKYVNNNWSLLQQILPPNPSIFNFGISVSLKGNKLLVGSMPFAFELKGQAYVYEFDGTNWVYSSAIEGIDGSIYFGSFGETVSLSDSGTRAIVGDKNYQDSSSDGFTPTGAAYVFDYDGTEWNQSAQLFASDPHGYSEYASAVSISGDRVVVGAFYHDGEEALVTQAGAVYVYENNAGTWSQSIKLTQSNATLDDWFGRSVSLEDNRLAVGAYGVDDTASQAGAVYVFDYDGTDWVETKLLDEAGDFGFQFGISVSLQGDKVLIGANHYNTETQFNSGAAYLYELNNTGWSQTDILLAYDGTNYDNFGWSVSLSGGLSLVGAIFDDENAVGAGSAYIVKTGLIFRSSFD